MRFWAGALAIQQRSSQAPFWPPRRSGSAQPPSTDLSHTEAPEHVARRLLERRVRRATFNPHDQARYASLADHANLRAIEPRALGDFGKLREQCPRHPTA